MRFGSKNFSGMSNLFPSTIGSVGMFKSLLPVTPDLSGIAKSLLPVTPDLSGIAKSLLPVTPDLSGIAKSFLPVTPDLSGIAKSFLPVTPDLSGIAKSLLPVTPDLSGIAKSFLPATHDLSGIAKSFLPATHDLSDIAKSFLPATHDLSGIAKSFLPATHDLSDIAKSFLPANHSLNAFNLPSSAVQGFEKTSASLVPTVQSFDVFKSLIPPTQNIYDLKPLISTMRDFNSIYHSLFSKIQVADPVNALLSTMQDFDRVSHSLLYAMKGADLFNSSLSIIQIIDCFRPSFWPSLDSSWNSDVDESFCGSGDENLEKVACMNAYDAATQNRLDLVEKFTVGFLHLNRSRAMHVAYVLIQKLESWSRSNHPLSCIKWLLRCKDVDQIRRDDRGNPSKHLSILSLDDGIAEPRSLDSMYNFESFEIALDMDKFLKSQNFEPEFLNFIFHVLNGGTKTNSIEDLQFSMKQAEKYYKRIKSKKFLEKISKYFNFSMQGMDKG